MNRILKKTAVMIMAAAIGVSMNYQGEAVFTGTNNNITKQARYVEPEEWNRTESPAVSSVRSKIANIKQIKKAEKKQKR